MMKKVFKRGRSMLLSAMLALPCVLPLHTAPAVAQEYTTNPQDSSFAAGENIRVASHETPEEDFSAQNQSTAAYAGELNGFAPVLDENGQEAQIVPRKVIGRDERRPVEDTSKAPYSGICRLTINFSNGDVYSGTGFFLTPDTVLTAGHCVYDNTNNLGWARSITVVPGNADPSKEENQYHSASLKAPMDWVTNRQGDTDYDLGLIKLNRPVDDSVAMLKLRTLDHANFAPVYELPGYPYTPNLELGQEPMMTARGSATALAGRRTLLHTIDSSSGQSGAPILNADNEVEAIHTFAKTKEEFNGATAVDSYVCAFVASQAPELPAPVYRLYNPNSGEHFYTTNYDELVYNVQLGWKDEGVAWRSEKGGTPVYRLYNPNAGDHHYTLDLNEREQLVKLGWDAEDISWYAATDEKNDAPVYRLYNPNAQAGAHHFTLNPTERDGLVKFGWTDEGTAFYSK